MIFTIKKFLINKKTLILFALVALILSGLFLFYKLQVNENMYLLQKESLQQIVQESQKNLINAPDDPTIKNVLEKQLNLAKLEKKAWDSKNYNHYYQLVNQSNLDFLKNSNTAIGNISDTKDSITYYNAAKASGQSLTMGQGFNDKAFGDTANSMTAWLSSLLFFILFALICADFMGNEFPDKIRLYKIIKIKKKKLLINYLLVPVLSLFIFICSLFFIFFIITWFWKGLGSPTYPFGQKLFITKPVLEIGAWAIAYLFFTLLFISSLGQLISIIFKKAYLASSFIIILLVGFYLIKDKEFMSPFLKWVPLTYLASGQVINYSSKLFGASSLMIGVCILAVSSLIFYSITSLCFNKYIYRRT